MISTREAFIIGAAALWLAMPALARDQPISLRGHWHVDFGRSYDPYTTTPPRSVTLDVITDNGQVYEAQETDILADGKVRKEYIWARVDGKFYPVQDSSRNFSVAITHWTPGSIRMQIRAPSGVHSIEICEISTDLKTIACDEIDTNLQGKSTSAKSVYVRD